MYKRKWGNFFCYKNYLINLSVLQIKLQILLTKFFFKAEFITGLTLKNLDDFKNAAKNILTMGPQIVIITLGSKGALICQRTTNSDVFMEVVSAPKVNAVDTVVS